MKFTPLVGMALAPLAILFILFACATAASAAPVVRKPTGIGHEFPTIMRGVRMLGMGNAFIAMPGTDSFAPFYNPAAINDYDRKIRYSFTIPGAGFSPGFFEAVDDLFDLKDELHSAQGARDKIHYFDQFVSRHTGEYNYFSSAMPLFQARNRYFSASLIVDNRTVISLRNQAFPNFEFLTQSTMGAVGGGAIGLFHDRLQLGGNLKLLFSMGVEDQVTTRNILTHTIKELIGFDSWEKGFGVGADAGIKYRLPIWEEALRPTLALTVQDIANTRFTGGVEELPMSVSAGIGLFPRPGGNPFSFVFDFRELNRQTNFMSKFHAGVEFTLPEVVHPRISLRGGCNQGYPTFGLSVAWKLVTLHTAFYGEEAGEYTSAKGSYRFAAQLDFNL